MDMRNVQNETMDNAFVLLGIIDFPHLQSTLFAVLLIVYIMTMLGNFAITWIVVTNSHLHNPMFTFICNLALLEMSFISVTVPKMLTDYITKNQLISFYGCFLQIYFLHFFGSIECFILCFMAFDRLVAICHPLQYSAFMSQSFCHGMITLSLIMAFTDAVLHTALTSRIHFCGANKVLNFFCDVPPLLVISCSDTTVNEVILKSAGAIVGLSTALITVLSYACVITTICSIKATKGKWKPFSTCSSHIAVLTLFYGSGLSTYIFQSSSTYTRGGHIISLCYSVMTPFLNPIIYSLRNKKINQAMAKSVKIIILFLRGQG